MDESIQTAQAPENVQQFNQPPIGEPPKERGVIKKIFNASSWFVFFALLPATVLILLSQNTIPGDLFYPLKRGMENVVLAAATVSPATRVAFRTDLTERRFDEAERLLLARSDTTGLSDFIKEVQTAQQEASTLSNLESKKESTEKLIKKIDEYQNKLVQVRAKTQSPTVAPLLPEDTPVSTLTSTSQVTPIPQQDRTATLFPTPTTKIIRVIPTSAQEIISPKPTSVVPTTEASPTQVQVPPSPTSVPSVSDDEVEEAIDVTQKKLDEIKNKLKKGHGDEAAKEKNDKEEDRAARGDYKSEEAKKEKNRSQK